MEARSFDSLPFDIIIEIFQYLPIEELVSSVQYVNKHWQNVIQDPIFWKDVWYKPGAGTNTDDVVTLLQRAPLLRSFEFREGLQAPEIVDVLCENQNITSLAFDACVPSTEIIQKLLEKLPNLEFLQVPLVSFLLHIAILGRFPNLKTMKCTQVFHQDDTFNLRNREQLTIGDTDWCAFEVLELYSEHINTNFEKMIVHVREKLRTLEIQALHSSKILEHIPYSVHLQTLKLNFLSRQIQDVELNNFLIGLRKLTDLKCLSLTSFVHEDANLLCKVFQKTKFPKLTELELKHCSNFSPRAAQTVVAACPVLTTVCLSGCVVLDDLCLRELGRCTNLSVLDISGCPMISEIGLAHLTGCYNLRELNLNWIGLLSIPMLEQISKLKRLYALHLDHTEANLTHLLDCVNKLPALRFLSVYRTSGISGSVLEKALRHCSVQYTKPGLCAMLKENANKMKKFQIHGVADDILLSIPDCDTVEECSLDFLLRPCDTFPNFFTMLKKSKKLQSLTLANFVTSESGLLCQLFDGGLPQLRVLELEQCFSVDHDVAVSIALNFPQLEKLRLQNCVAFNNDALAAIVQMKHLHVLDVSDCCNLSETGLLYLGQCKSLRELNLCGVVSAAISEEIINCILSLPELSILHIDFSDSTDKHLESKKWFLKCRKERIAKYMTLSEHR